MPQPEAPPETLPEAFDSADALEGSIDQKLAHFTTAARRLVPDIAAAYDRLVAHLVASGAGADAPDIGDQMPDFLLPDQDGRLVGIGPLLASGPLVVSFNRGHWCAYCRLELRALGRAHEAIAAAGAGLVSIVPETAEFSKSLRQEHGLPFRVLSDIDNGYALSLGLLVWIGAEVQAVYDRLGIDLAKFNNNAGGLVPIPATFVVGRDGRIKARCVDPDYRRRLSVNEILKALA
jgi:peroxiredoxin